ncbi:hypothetical protein CEE34_10615 [Candidatus Aerophobetes bacterium Ae_b3a]|nr:MAG: hypothetical protein CEE34_10615 [Candidatus Aerophobetes bacterium Ae_b3a]
MTIRPFSDALREKIVSSVKRIAQGIVQGAGVPEDRIPVVSVYGSGLALYNDPEPTKRITRVFRETFGKENVIDPGRIMGSEDFANFGTVEPKILLTYFAIGVIDPKVYKARVKEDKLPPSPHNPHFAPSLS